MSKELYKNNFFQEEDFDDNLNIKHAVKKISFKIHYTLKSRNLTQTDLASLLDVSPQNISKLLKGEDYKVSTLVRIEEALDITLINRDIKNNNESSFFTETKEIRMFSVKPVLFHFKNDNNFTVEQNQFSKFYTLLEKL